MNVKSRIGQLVGESINAYNNKLKPIIEEVELREKYQSRIIECMIGEVDDNYIETPEVTESVFKLEYSKEGLVKLPTIKGKTILVDADGNETSTPGEGCRLMSVGEKEDNKLIITSKNKNLLPYTNISIKGKAYITWFDALGSENASGKNTSKSLTFFYVPRGYVRFEADSLTNCIVQFVTREEKLVNIYSGSLFEGGEVMLRIKNKEIDKPFGIINGRLTWKSEDIVLEGQSYAPHQSHKAEILLDEPLRSLPNGVCDEIIGNQLIRRVGVMIFKDGNLFGAFQNYDLTYKYGMGISHDIIGSTTLIADTIPYKQKLTIEEESTETQVCIYHHTLQKEIRISFLKSDYPQITNNKETFVEYLKNNPLTIYYELAEPIIEELPNSIALQCFDDTTMYIENSITPTVTYGYNALIPYKEELAKQREEVDNNVLDIETNIIPYLTEIEYNLNRMEGN